MMKRAGGCVSQQVMMIPLLALLVEEQGVDINNKEVVCATMAISIYFLHACLISRSFLSSSEA